MFYDEDAVVPTGLLLFRVMIFIAVVIGLIMVFIDNNYNRPIAAQDALNQCMLRGYDSYSSFDRPLFSEKAYGVRCNLVANERKIVSNAPLIVGVN